MDSRVSFASKLGAWSLYLAVFCLPFQTHILLYQADWARGLSNPYAAVYFNVFNMLYGLSLLMLAWDHFQKKQKLNLGEPYVTLSILGLLSLYVVSWLLSPKQDFILSIFLLSQNIMLFGFYFLAIQNKVNKQIFLKTFVWSMTLQAILACIQGLSQNSVGLYILGEPHLNESTANLAKVDFLGTWFRAYGTFPHPNILGGFLSLSILSTFLIKESFKHEKKILWTLQILALFLSFSRSASLALIISICFLAWKSYLKWKPSSKMPLILGSIFAIQMASILVIRGLALYQDSALIERLEGAKIATKMLIEYPLGVGANQYTLFMDTVSQTPLKPWEYQPVHNAFLLGFAELGLIGGLILVLASIWALHKLYLKPILFAMALSFILIAQIDHYLFSLEIGNKLLLFLAILANHYEGSVEPTKDS